MIKCKNPAMPNWKCIIDMGMQHIDSVCCEKAEGCGFRREHILAKCEHAEPGDIRDAALQELFS